MSGVQRIVGTSSRWDFHTWHRCEEPAGKRDFAAQSVAAFWLMRFKSDPTAMADLRGLAETLGDAGLPLSRTNDDQALVALSWLLVHGVLHVHEIAPPATAFRVAQQASAAESPASRPTNTPQRASAQTPQIVPVSKAEEADTFSARADGAAIAAVLRNAAASGVPFCEECAKAAAVKQAV